MDQDGILRPEAVLRNCFRAKDENRPHLLGVTFQPDAVLEVVNFSEAISFPATTVGREGIADVLVRRFGQTYENVYSFYLQRPDGVLDAFSCSWFVAMSLKEGRSVRVGCGRYDWTFGMEPPRLASRLVITISAMVVLPASTTDSVFAWILGLPYPWASAEGVCTSAPHTASLEPVLRCLRAA